MPLACSKHGSRVLDAIWNKATLPAKREIAQELGKTPFAIIQGGNLSGDLWNSTKQMEQTDGEQPTIQSVEGRVDFAGGSAVVCCVAVCLPRQLHAGWEGHLAREALMKGCSSFPHLRYLRVSLWDLSGSPEPCVDLM